ncbi:MAG: ABC transporter ATP-binding protein [Thermoplasmata archaeon]|nr:ABC transporter ATP-binding protein [Thermoplasmata archaeon]
MDAVTKSFGTQDALSSVTARVQPGTVGLVGPNGAGKTTLLRLMLGLLPPTSGALRVMGFDSWSQPLSVRARVGYMPEHDCLIPTMTGIGFVAYMARVSGVPAETAMSRAHDVLQFVGLHEERYRRIQEYSVGMRQRVKLAQAIVHDPPLCLLDEPTAGLDPKGRQEMLDLLRALAKLGNRSLILATHLLPDVEGLCDQIILLHTGRLLAAGPLEPLLRSRANESVVRIRGDRARFLSALASRGLSARASGDELRLKLPVGGERLVFEAARESDTQVRFLGKSVQSVEDLFIALVDAAGARGNP